MEGFEFTGIRLPKLNSISGEEAERIDSIISSLGLEGYERKKAEKIFKNKDFFNALPQEWRDNPEIISDYIKNGSLFNAIVHEERKKAWSGDTDGLLTHKVTAKESVLPNGSARRTESGHQLNVGYLQSKGIEASKVLFYRRTQPGEETKPEMYWTSDFSEVASGLGAEISGDQRKSSIVLVLDLETLEKLGGGLIQDVNDDSGISVRTISSEGIDQKESLFSIKNPELLAPND